MDVGLFDFDLPDSCIALRPAQPRDAAKMLVVRPGAPLPFSDHVVSDLPGLLRSGDVLVLNQTRVIPSRLYGMRLKGEGGARVEIMLHKRESAGRWLAFARPAKKLTIGDVVRFGPQGAEHVDAMAPLEAVVDAKGEGGEVELSFGIAGPHLDEAIARLGEMPLPPYIAGKRAADARDDADYQTVYAREDGAVAAPTAGLHFTDELFGRLNEAGITREFVTLHVGAGTFLPMKTQDTREHRMHAEWGAITEEVAARLNAARAGGGRIIAVGTTSLRLLESAAQDNGAIAPFSGDTSIFITPGYRFRAVDALMTNFHLPRSTLFMLVSALSGLDTMTQAYAHAIAQDYRFYSYGDASLLFPAP
jgi:S-adenosylmethionine:tRNA ribosyltransferase-isomerase